MGDFDFITIRAQSEGTVVLVLVHQVAIRAKIPTEKLYFSLVTTPKWFFRKAYPSTPEVYVKLSVATMDMSSLFPSDSVAAEMPADLSAHVSFRAGFLSRDPSSNQVTADPRQGVFQITTSVEDGLNHIQWKERNTTNAEHDLILINGEIEMKQVTSCSPSARIYVLKWRESETRLFLWMQEKDASQDATNVSLVNSILENGPTPQQV